MPTPITQTNLSVINQALTGFLGEGSITDLATDQDTKAIVMRANYESVSEYCQTLTTWRFNTTKVALNLLSGSPLNRWSACWQLPADLLKVITVWPPGAYEIQGKRLYNNDSSQAHLDYQRKYAEAYWPAWFTRLVVIELAMRTSKGITGDEPDQAMKDELKAATVDAFFQDAQQQPNQTMQTNDFIDVRF